MNPSHSIEFDYEFEGGKIKLLCDVQIDQHRFIATNFRTEAWKSPSIIGDLTLEKVGGSWVNAGSHKETCLTQAIGTAIETQLHSVTVGRKPN
jgi:hypothetical protein